MIWLVIMAFGCDEPNMIVLMGSGVDACAKCGADQSCEEGVCKDKPEEPCAKCTAEQTCVDGVCKATENLCDCSDDQICEGGKCVDKPDDPCGMCNENQTCKDGVCKDKPEDPCAKCTENQTCEDGVCKDKPEDPCAKCGEDQICMDGECKAKPVDPCVKCGADQICEDGVCKDKPIDDPCSMCPESCDGIKCSDICTDDNCANGCVCPEGKICRGDRCVEKCKQGERMCVGDDVLKICEEEIWQTINCDDGYYCSEEYGNVCVHKLTVNGDGEKCKEGTSICASNSELLVCVRGIFVSKNCENAKVDVSADRMRCTINNSGGAECVELLGDNKDECADDEDGYLRCAGQNKGVRKCNFSNGKWKWEGGNCGGGNKCVYVLEDGMATAICQDGCSEGEDKCEGEVIMKCVNRVWMKMTDCLKVESKCVSNGTIHCQ